MKRKILPYKPYLKEIAKKLRKNMTLSEILLWEQLKNKQILGHDFDRQKPKDNYIVDFYCKDLQLAIEVDGDSHDSDEAIEKDIKRQNRLESLGVHFLRFDDLEIKFEMDYVLFRIRDWIEKHEKK